MSTNGYNGNCGFQQQNGPKINTIQNQNNVAINPQIQSPNFNQSANKTQNHKEKLDEIRQQLQPYMINERPTSSASSTSETSSNYVKQTNGAMFDIYHHSNYQQSNFSNQYSPLPKYRVDNNGQLIDYYKNGYKTDQLYSYTPSNCSDKQSPTPTLNSDYSHSNKLNGNKLLVSSISSCSSSQNSYAPNLFGNTGQAVAYHKSNSNQKSELTSLIDDHTNGQHCNNFNGNNNLISNNNLLNNNLNDQTCTNLQTAKLQAWSVRQTKSQSPVIMQSVKSTQVQKPILQTACAPIVNQQPLINNNNLSSTTISYQQRACNMNNFQFNEKSLKTDLVQLNPNIAKKFLNKVIALEKEDYLAANNQSMIYQKQQMTLPEPPPIKSSVSNSPVYSVLSDKSNLSNLTNNLISNLTNNLNNLEQFVRTSSALSNCSNFTSYSNASSSITSSSKNQQPPPYTQIKPPANLLSSSANKFVINQTVHAKPVTINNASPFIDEQSQSRPPPYCESLLNTSSSSNNFVDLINHQETYKLSTNNLIQQPSDPPSYATSVAVLMKQKNQLDLMSKSKNITQKISRPLPPLPNEKPSDDLRSNTPIQTAPPLPPKPVKLATATVQQPIDNFINNYTDELDCTSSTGATFNATANLQILQKQLEQHLHEQKPLVEKLKQIHLQKHQQKVLLNLKVNSNAAQNSNQQQVSNPHNSSHNNNVQNNHLPPPPILPAKNLNNLQSTNNNNTQQTAVKSITSLKRPVPAPPLLPKKDCLINKRLNDQLNTVPPPINHQDKPTAKKQLQNEYENTSKCTENGNNNNESSFNQNNNDEQDEEYGSKTTHHSPIPQRKLLSKEREQERRESKVKNYSAAAYKFFMEQHIENVIKSHKQRVNRKNQLENEMLKANLADEAQLQMRKMLQQKESNYIRLKRARMEKSMFDKISTLGIGAFGEVSLVKKIDTNQLYAMKTLRKTDILKRNQFAHVKAERDILAEADNEWIVKLYYSFQDEKNLYFVMEYIPGGDLMALLIKLEIFEESLARFYIGELVLAIESIHKISFLHRDIKVPDNILIDRDGHIKLTDFGLCTGFRWTHDSKYYQCSGYETVELGFTDFHGDLSQVCGDFAAFNELDDEINERSQNRENFELNQQNAFKKEIETFSKTTQDAQQVINKTNESTNTLPMNDEIVKKCDKCLKTIQVCDIICGKCKQQPDNKDKNCFDCISLRNSIIANIKICNNCNKPLERRRKRQNLRNQAHSLVGTPNYIAPEVLQKTAKGYRQSCDWWSVGVILYEMVIGRTPFLAATAEETQHKVINWQNYLHIPPEAQLSAEVTDLILKLCTSPENRLGSTGADAIKAHPFFKNFDFNDLRKQPAPYIPYIQSATDTSNFDPVEMERQISDTSYNHNYENNDYMVTSEDGGQLTNQRQNSKRRRDKKIPEHAFFEFTFRRFFDEAGNALPILNICRDGTLKTELSKVRNFNNLTEEYSTEDNEDQSSENQDENTVDQKKEEKDDKKDKSNAAPVYV